MTEYNRKLYWLGNIAKTRIIDDILHSSSDRGGNVTIFDFGCGDGGDWPTILSENPFLYLVGYEPAEISKRAIERLTGHNAQILTGDAILKLEIAADFIVSFSVFEHVVNKISYLNHAKRLLSKNGVFYLNYDDGHFRNMLDLSNSSTWLPAIRSWFRTIISPSLAKLGVQTKYQQRVMQEEANQLVLDAGFQIYGVDYHNLASLKDLFKSIPYEQREAFAHVWLNLEHTLNRYFTYKDPSPINGDNINLWQQMPSRTLRLRHA